MSPTRFDPKPFLERVGAGFTTTVHPSGAIICKQGAPSDSVFYLHVGHANATVMSERGKVVFIGMVEPNMFFGTSALADRPTRPSTVTAITRCTVTEISLTAMRKALGLPQFSRLFNAYLVDRINRIEADRVELVSNSSQRRLMLLLLKLSRANEGPPQHIGPEISQEVLAEMTRSTRPRVNFFLNNFRRLRYIKYNDGGIMVLPELREAVLRGPLEIEEPEQ